ncbi:Transglycosylase SLT domain-containing protein [Rhodovulum sp. ES.010]|uniref:transglycosylase SLT domain-containing protein n=1 Tax=Rhodovulum sp. ES.010 TaxID=1882821 RepID=UPI000926150D|nr:transglycosylase SLT domain-containing protein [Rhodovulum sp. ES.010]SIO22449.1 Transglycosylase SLT domain-containing protein [Rhodovulum sp. ES.010]
MRFALLALVLALPMGCSHAEPPGRAQISTSGLPTMRWDHRPEAPRWTEASLAALRAQGAPLAETVPADIANWCPTYAQADLRQRRAFWAGLFSALAKHESTWNPEAVGGGGRWFGLMQIAPATARGYGCAAQSGEALKDGAANIGCAIRIAARTVPRDGVVAAGGGGVAADWGPMTVASKRAEIAAWTRAQPYCGG